MAFNHLQEKKKATWLSLPEAPVFANLVEPIAMTPTSLPAPECEKSRSPALNYWCGLKIAVLSCLCCAITRAVVWQRMLTTTTSQKGHRSLATRHDTTTPIASSGTGDDDGTHHETSTCTNTARYLLFPACGKFGLLPRRTDSLGYRCHSASCSGMPRR